MVIVFISGEIDAPVNEYTLQPPIKIVSANNKE
jgi:hypothetical protein